MNDKIKRIISELEERVKGYTRQAATTRNSDIRAIYERQRAELRLIITELETGQLDLETTKKK